MRIVVTGLPKGAGAWLDYLLALLPLGLLVYAVFWKQDYPQAIFWWLLATWRAKREGKP